jgi:hypothetical protein
VVVTPRKKKKREKKRGRPIWRSHGSAADRVGVGCDVCVELDVFSPLVFLWQMLIPKKDRLAIYSRLFQDGVMVAKKNYNGKHHVSDARPSVFLAQT